ncbi:methyl-accepting chemotaxis protein [Aeromonas simiae]|uniref:methyl-accepting chemotaxis protein n=1 Tax=Aeromonas simiae TaxID=218936 RepID=UPI00266BF48B|nr:methyl-accepting chemotaxis protein [Aeromonas simiae]MDO2947990.1 methyl-accepting chemotaxis protein [Aeromonas simiae]MDO2952241.1 methyl-accepting chemotaxis protein [Aeromonas simiae]MDO2955373.1 methyl-accepting chemotaxis protein [Aeromonas simiae]
MLTRLSIRHRLLLITLLALLSLLLLTLVAAEQYRRSLLEEKQVQTRHQVETVWSLVDGFARQVSEGKLSEAQAKQAALKAIAALRYGHDDYFWINDSRPFMVMHPMKPELDGKDLAAVADPDGKRLFVAFVEATRHAPQGAQVAYQWPKPGSAQPVAKVSFVKRFAPWDWIIGTGIYVDDVEQQYRQVLLRLLGVSLVILTLLALLSGWLGRSIVQPLEAASRALAVLARGEGDLRARLHERGRDELSALGRNFNRFADQMVTLVQQVQGIARDNDGAAERLAGVAHNHHRLANEQVADTERVASAMSQVAASCQEIGEHTREAAGSAAQAMAMVHDGEALMQRSAEVVQRLADQLGASVASVKQLGADSQKIDGVLEVIRGVAEQTNLLALNAAIEAARAGEQGRGFAVVADEVRTLANRTHASTDEIRNMIASVQHGTDQVTAQIGQLQGLSDAAAHSVAQMERVIAELAGLIDRIGGMNGQIASAADQQVASVAGINHNMETIARAAHRALEHNEQTEQAVAALEAGGRQLSALVDRYQT